MNLTRHSLWIAPVAVALMAAGCDEEKQHDAAKKAGDGVEKAVNVAGDASRDAAHAVGNAFEKAGDKLKVAADDASTRPATRP